MSLKKIAEVKRKRRFSTGDGVYEGDGYAGSDMGMGYQGGNYGGPADVGESVSGSAASHAGTEVDGSGQGTEYGVPGPSTGVYGGSVEYNGETLPGGAERTMLGQMMDKYNSMSPAQQRALSGVLPGGALLTSGLGFAVDKMGLGWTGGNNVRGGSNADSGDFFAGRANDGHEPLPFGNDTPVQTTPPPGAGAGAPAVANTGMRQYMWDPVVRQYRLANLGAQDNPMGYSQGQVFQMAAGGRAPSGISAGMPRFVQGGGTGLSDSVPVQMDDGGEGRLADGEFVIPADVVSGLGGGSSAAGSKMLFDMMERIREQAHGKTQQIRPVDPQQVLPA